MRIAMWSGPRNLSTAMMYSFAARPDCDVMDEPFYAAYLAATGIEHPIGADIIASGDRDPVDVIARCLAGSGDGRISYQKHMCQHMIEGFDRGWMSQMANVFLIRHPARVLASYAVKRENPTLDDIGFATQRDMIRAFPDAPVIDSATIRGAPEAALTLLCGAIGIRFDPAMLSWPKGGNPADGVWAKHWYGAVWQSTGFAGAEGPLPNVAPEHAGVFAAAMDCYQEMSAHALTLT
ncbi:MAG: HAD family hydrolase [Pseudomonadota bacterium]